MGCAAREARGALNSFFLCVELSPIGCSLTQAVDGFQLEIELHPVMQ